MPDASAEATVLLHEEQNEVLAAMEWPTAYPAFALRREDTSNPQIVNVATGKVLGTALLIRIDRRCPSHRRGKVICASREVLV